MTRPLTDESEAFHLSRGHRISSVCRPDGCDLIAWLERIEAAAEARALPTVEALTRALHSYFDASEGGCEHDPGLYGDLDSLCWDAATWLRRSLAATPTPAPEAE